MRKKFKIKHKKIDRLIYIILTVFFILYLLSLNYKNADILVTCTFLLIGFISYYKIIMSDRNISLYRLFYVYIFIFLFIAPLQQYLESIVLWTSDGLHIEYNDHDYLLANILILIFILIFECSYFLFNKKHKTKNYKIYKPSDFSIYLLVVLSLISVFYLVVSGVTFDGTSNSDSFGMQIIKILEYFPVCCFIITYCQYKEYGIRVQRFSLFIYLLEILIIYFPFNGTISRFLLFGVYLILINLIFSKAKIKSVYFLLFVIGFFFVFSAFNFFKYHDLSDWRSFSLSIVDFKTVDYDAYQIIMASMKYVSSNSLLWGKNFLAAVLCFIPRSVWGNKAFPSGQIVFEYYNVEFTNVSCPLFAEFYLAFGWVGIILGAFLTGYVLHTIDAFDDSPNLLKRGIFCTISGLMIYILRGALLPTISYTFALLIALVIVCCIDICASKFYIIKEKYNSVNFKR